MKYHYMNKIDHQVLQRQIDINFFYADMIYQVQKKVQGYRYQTAATPGTGNMTDKQQQPRIKIWIISVSAAYLHLLLRIPPNFRSQNAR